MMALLEGGMEDRLTPQLKHPPRRLSSDSIMEPAPAVVTRTNHRASVHLLLAGLVSFSAVCYFLVRCDLGDPELKAAYAQQAPRAAYSWAGVAFATALCLNFLSLLFEQEPSKKQLVYLACYVNLLAAASGFLSATGLAPVMRDVWGGGLCVLRITMWLHTTPAMVYLLSLISNFSKARTITAVTADILMILVSFVGHLSPQPFVSALGYCIAFSLFGFVITEMWRMYDLPIADSTTENSRFCLKVLRFTSVGLWFTLPLTFFVIKLGGVSLYTEEWLWTIADFLGKVTFSSSLLYGNFMTIEQRRLIVMRQMEQHNRMQVILELQELVKQKERFMSSVSHELRTPLNGIIGLSESLLASAAHELSESSLRAVTAVKSSGLKLLTLINNVLDANLMRLGRLVIKDEPVNMADVARDVMQVCQPLANPGVKMRNTITPDLPPVRGDMGRIVQILFNLLSNSCKFTERGHITLSATLEGDRIRVSVEDSGIGIPEARFNQVFQAFEQVDMSATRKYGGTGLGLNLVKQLVEAHGGTIAVRSTVARGTTFEFLLRVWQGPLESREPRPPRASKELQRLDKETKACHQTQLLLRAGSASSQGSWMGLPVKRDLHMLMEEDQPMERRRRSTGRSSLSRQGQLEYVSQPVPLARLRTPDYEYDRAADLAVATPLGRGKLVFGRKRCEQTLVLSVDDDPVNQLVIQSLLVPEGYKVVQAMDGMEALALLETMDELPDIILLDVMMPGMSGYEVCAKLRTMPPFDCVPIIMLSAKSKVENVVQGLHAGSNDYVAKPFGRQELLARIASHLCFRDTVYVAALKEGRRSGSGSQQKGGGDGSVLGGVSPEQYKALQHSHDLLEQQLDEVSAECERLQAELDIAVACAPSDADQSAAATVASGSAGAAAAAVATDVLRLQQDNQVLERQLEEVTNECERLQAELDSVHAELATIKGSLAGAAPSRRSNAGTTLARTSSTGTPMGRSSAGGAALRSATSCASEDVPLVVQLREQVAALQVELEQATLAQQQVEVQLEEAEEELIKVHQDKRLADIELRAARRHLAAVEGASADGQLQAARPGPRIVGGRHSGSMPSLGAMLNTLELSARASNSMPLPRRVVGPSWSASNFAAARSPSASRLSQCTDMVLMKATTRTQASTELNGAQRQWASRPMHSVPSGVTPEAAMGTQLQPYLPADYTDDAHVQGHMDQGDSIDRLAQLLHEASLEWLLPKFMSEDITPKLLLYLDDDALRELGVSSMGARIRLRTLAERYVHAD